MLPKIVVQIPGWVWVVAIVGILTLGAWVILTEPDPEPSVKNHLRHLVFLWARNAQRVSTGHPSGSSSTNARSNTHRLWENYPTGDNNNNNNTPSNRSPRESRGEQACREYMESRFGVPFPKTRPDFLRNPVTGENLELDVYNHDLKIGVEYNGQQHYEFNNHFHRSSNDRFQNQQYRDLIKKQLCEQNNIQLVVVPYWIPIEQIPSFIEQELIRTRTEDSDYDPVTTTHDS